MTKMGPFAILVVMATICCGLSAEEPDLLFTADPPVITINDTDTFQLNCELDKPLEGVLLVMDILKVNESGDVLVARQRMKTTTGDDDRYTAEGHLKTMGDAKPSFLTVTVVDASTSDEGLYKCRVYYMHPTHYKIQHIIASVNFTVEVLPPPTLPSVTELIEVQVTEKVETTACKCDEIWDEIHSLKETLVLENQLLKEEVQKYNESCRVSFSARLTGDSRLFNNMKAPFNDVISNKGHAFNPQTSVFVAPCPAQYFFSLTLRSHQNMDSGYVDGYIMVDGEEMARTSVFIDQPVANYQSATNGAVVTLDKGQEVSVVVKTTSNGKLKSSTYSVFSGFYLYP